MKHIFFLFAVAASPAMANDLVVTRCDIDAQGGVCIVRNEGQRAVGEVSYTALATEAGRSFPWGERHERLKIAGGIEPGEVYSIAIPVIVVPDRAKSREILYEVHVRPVVLADPGRASPMIDLDVPLGPSSDFAELVSQCWNRGSLSTEAASLTLVVALRIDGEYLVEKGSITLLESSDGSEGAVKQAYEAARRAILMCASNADKLREALNGTVPEQLTFTRSGAVF